MSSIINTNALSLVTQNNLTKSQGALNTAIQRLSSGMRINSAKDDAAGQAIANRFTANIKGLTQASRNANDGISLAQTTEGALGEINTNLQRIRELAVQSVNGSNSADDKASIQAEITQRLAEIDRTSQQTDFNGTKVLSDKAGKLSIQVGAKDGESISINLEEISSKTLNLTGFNVDKSGTPNTAATKDNLLVAGFTANAAAPVNGTQQYDKITNNAAATSANVFSALKAPATTTGAITYAGTNTGLNKAATADYTYVAASDSFSFDSAGVAKADIATFLKPAVGGTTAATVDIGGTTQDILISSTGAITAKDDGSDLYLDATGNLTKTRSLPGDPTATLANLTTAMSAGAADAGGKITVGTTVMTSTAASTFDVVGATIKADALQSLANVGGYTAKIDTDGTGVGIATTSYVVAAGPAAVGGSVQIGAAAVFMNNAAALTLATTTTTSYYEHSNGAVMDNAGNAVYADSAAPDTFTLNARSGNTATADPLKALDAALAKVDGLRSELGAVQNRFDSVISNLGTTITNLSSSRSRIEDADYATEVSNMTRANILQQAGTSVLAQANQSTQGVLSLLR